MYLPVCLKMCVKLKVKVEFFLSIKPYGGVKLQRHLFLTSALGGDEWLLSLVGRVSVARRVGGFPIRTGCFGEEINLFLPKKTTHVQSVASAPCRLLCSGARSG